MNKLLKVSTFAVMALVASAAFGIREAHAGYYTTYCDAFFNCWDVYVPTCNIYGVCW
jgi:hypothetical protein